MEDALEAFDEHQVPDRVPCPVCQRKFNEDVLTRHIGICEKSAKKRRKPFSSQKQRWIGTDVPVETLKKQKQSEPTPKKNNWRAKHEAFLASVRAARGCPEKENNANGHRAKPTPVVNPDYVQCPHCERRFNEHSATRHIEFCKEQKSRIVPKKSGPQDLTKLAKRTQYKPPLPGKKKSVDSHSASTPQRRIVSPKYGNSSYIPSSAGKEKKQPALRRTQSHDLPDTWKEPVLKRRSGNLADNTDGSTNGLHSPKKTPVKSGASSKTNHVSENDLFHDDDISRAASGNRRNRGQISSAGLENVLNGQRTSGGRKKAEQRTLYDLGDDGSGSGDDSGYRAINSGRRKGSRHNSPSSVSRTESGISVGSAGREGSGVKLSKFCYECGTKYPVANAKYCCECGVKRLHIET